MQAWTGSGGMAWPPMALTCSGWEQLGSSNKGRSAPSFRPICPPDASLGAGTSTPTGKETPGFEAHPGKKKSLLFQQLWDHTSWE